MPEQEQPEPRKNSTLGERMGDFEGIRVLRNGKWISLKQNAKQNEEKQNKEK